VVSNGCTGTQPSGGAADNERMTNTTKPSSPLSPAATKELLGKLRWRAVKSALGIAAALLVCMWWGVGRDEMADATRGADAPSQLQFIGLFAIFLGVLPALAVYRLTSRDIRLASRLLGRGDAYPATVAKLGIPWGGRLRFDLAWNEQDRECKAHFEADRARSLKGDEDVMVVALARSPHVVAVVGTSNLCVGRRL
jgi:hypothetical protein